MANSLNLISRCYICSNLSTIAYIIEIQSLLMFDSVNFTDQTQVAELNLEYMFIL